MTAVQRFILSCPGFYFGYIYLLYLLLVGNFSDSSRSWRPSPVDLYTRVTAWWWIIHNFNCKSCRPKYPCNLNHYTRWVFKSLINGRLIVSSVSILMLCFQINSHRCFSHVSVTSIAYIFLSILKRGVSITTSIWHLSSLLHIQCPTTVLVSAFWSHILMCYRHKYWRWGVS